MNNNTRTPIDLALDRHTTILISGVLMLLSGAFGGCASVRPGDGPAKQQNFSTPHQTSGKGSEIPVDQIDLNQDGMISAAEQTIINGTSTDVLLTFGVISGAVFLSVLICAWMANRTSRKHIINKAAADMLVESEDQHDQNTLLRDEDLLGHNTPRS